MREFCEACGLAFDPHWRYPSSANENSGQSFCTRCHALWMEYVVSELHAGKEDSPGMISTNMIPYLRGEKPLIDGMHFDVVAEERVRAAVRESLKRGGA